MRVDSSLHQHMPLYTMPLAQESCFTHGQHSRRRHRTLEPPHLTCLDSNGGPCEWLAGCGERERWCFHADAEESGMKLTSTGRMAAQSGMQSCQAQIGNLGILSK